MMFKHQTIAVVIASCCIHSLNTGLYSQAPQPTKIEKDCDIVHTLGGYYRIEADLPDLRFGSTADITLNVRNSTGKDIVFGKLFSGCSCLETTLSDTDLPANGTLQIGLKLKVPAKSKSLEQAVPLSIMKSKDDRNDVSVILRYRFDEMAVFADTEIAKFVPEKSAKLTFRESLVVSSSIKLKELKLLPSTELKDVKLALVEEEGKYVVVGEISPEKIGAAGILGQLTLERVGHGVQDNLLVSLLIEPVLSLVPNPLTLKWDEDQKKFIGSVLIRHNKANDQEPSGKTESARLLSGENVVVKATCVDATVTCASRKLGPGFAKVSISVTPSIEAREFQSAENPDGLFLHVLVGGESFQTKCKYRFSGVQ